MFTSFGAIDALFVVFTELDFLLLLLLLLSSVGESIYHIFEESAYNSNINDTNNFIANECLW